MKFIYTEDLWRFVAILALSMLLGIVLNQFSLAIIIGLLIFIGHQYYQYHRVLKWMKKSQQNIAPQQSGLVDEFCREIEYSNKLYHIRKKRLAGYLKRYQEATNAMPDAVIILSHKNEIEWANDKAKRYVGISYPKDQRLCISNLIRYPDLIQYLEMDDESQQQSIQLPSPIDESIRLEYRVCLYGETQKLLVARDMTDIYRVDDVRKDFISNASHELKTPLTVTLGFIEGFVDDENCPPEWQPHLIKMHDQTKRMQYLIDEMLQLSQLEFESKNCPKSEIDVTTLLKAIVEEAKRLDYFLDQQFILSCDGDLNLYSYWQDLYSAFSNIIFNAVRYTSDQGHIKVSWWRDDLGAHMQVEDNGIGISKDHVSRLTERFYRVSSSRSRSSGGNGLGLAIAKHTLAKHNAKLNITSQLGQGSIFRCDFPSGVIDRLSAQQKISVA